MELPAPEPQEKRDYLIPLSVLIAGVVIAGAVIYAGRTKSGSPLASSNTASSVQLAKTVPQIGDDVVLGDPNAPVTVFEFGDYQCPYCARFLSLSEPRLRDEYIKTGKVKMVFKDLAFLGAESTAAAEAAECAKDQNAYWAYHDVLFQTEIQEAQASAGKSSENTGNLTEQLFLQLAGSLKLDTTTFQSCLKSRKYAQEVQGDVREAEDLGVQSTPQLFVNDQKLAAGAQPYEVLKAAIDAALATRK